MENKELSMYEYLLLLSIPEAAEEKIMAVKKVFHEKYKAQYALNKPHITLNTFTQYPTCEARIISRLQAIAQSFDKIKIELDGYSSFPTHTIYINVCSRIPVQELVRDIRSHTQMYMKPGKDLKPFFTTNPHLTIAKGLSNEQYEAAWNALEHQHFKVTFFASSMRLLRRPKGGKYTLVKQFVFENTKIEVTQGLLFKKQ